MKQLSMNLAGLVLAGTATAEPLFTVTVAPIDGIAGRYGITAELTGFNDQGFPVLCVWSDTSFELSGDGSGITIDAASANPGYTSLLFGSPIITNGTTASFVGIQPSEPLGNPDGSNPLSVVEFDYAGAIGALSLELVGQNFGTWSFPYPSGGPSPIAYQDSLGNTYFPIEIVIVPAPATLAVAPLALVAMRRRR